MPEANPSPGVTTATFKPWGQPLGLLEPLGRQAVPLHWVAVGERAWPGQSQWGWALPGCVGALSQVDKLGAQALPQELVQDI